MAQRRLSSALRSGFRIAGALLCVVAGSTATAAVHNATIPTYPGPVPPANLQPGDQMLIGDLPTSTVKFTWSQPAVPSPAEPRPVPTAFQYLCFYVTGTTHDCSRRTGIVARVEATGSTFVAHVVNPLRGIELITRRRIPGVNYEFTATLPANVLDKDLEWTVVACGNAAGQGCSQGPPRHLSLTARDLAATDIDAASASIPDGTGGTRRSVTATINVRNDGRTSDEGYLLETKVWQVLMNGNGDSAGLLKDTRDTRVQATDLVITQDGNLIPVSEFNAGRHDPSEAKGIHRNGFASASWSRRVPDVPPGAPVGQALQPGTCVAGGAPCPVLAVPARACDNADACWLAPADGTYPAGFVFFTEVNRGSPWDFEPADNHVFKGGVVVRP